MVTSARSCKLCGSSQSFGRLRSQPAASPVAASPKREATCCRCLPAEQPACEIQPSAHLKLKLVLSISYVYCVVPQSQGLVRRRLIRVLTNAVPGRG